MTTFLVILRIAVRNLLLHRSKTIIIGSLVALTVFALILGNSVLDTAAASYEKSFLRAFTGDLVIAGDVKTGASLLGGGGFGGSEPPPPIGELPAIRSFLAGRKEVEAVSPQVLGYATIAVDENPAGFSTLFGIDPDAYDSVFPDNLRIIEGRGLQSEDYGMLLNRTLVDSIRETTGTTVGAGDTLLLTSINLGTGTRIREIPVVGVFAFTDGNPNLDFISLLDAQSLRVINGMNLDPVEPVDLSSEEQALMGTNDEADLFGAGSIFGSGLVVEGETVRKTSQPAVVDTGTGANQPAEDSTRIAVDSEQLSENEAWHYLIVRTSSRAATRTLELDLKRFIDEQGLALTVMDWQAAAGPPGIFIGGIKVALNVAVLLIVIVSILVIMNSLVISVTERIPEIGTMRAIGAQRSFVWRMVVTETVVLTLSFGVVGVVLGSVLLLILSNTGLAAPNAFFRLLFGGETLSPVLSSRSIVVSVFGVITAGLVASLYPTSVALRIRPVVAMEAR